MAWKCKTKELNFNVYKESWMKYVLENTLSFPILCIKEVHVMQLRTHQANEDIYKAGLEVNIFICQDENGHNIA